MNLFHLVVGIAGFLVFLGLCLLPQLIWGIIYFMLIRLPHTKVPRH